MKIQIPQIPKYGNHYLVKANFIFFLNFSIILFLPIGLSAGSRFMNSHIEWEIREVDRLCRSGEVAHVGFGGPPRYTGFL